jgi:hypothetical protein
MHLTIIIWHGVYGLAPKTVHLPANVHILNIAKNSLVGKPHYKETSNFVKLYESRIHCLVPNHPSFFLLAKRKAECVKFSSCKHKQVGMAGDVANGCT